jgi:sortase A
VIGPDAESGSTERAVVLTSRRGLSRPIRRLLTSPVLIAVIAFAGLLLLLYPTAATWLSASQQSDVVNHYVRAVESRGPASRQAALAAAATYNSHLTGGASVDPGQRIPRSGQRGLDDGYDQQLGADDNGMMARIVIPSIDADLPIYHGTSEAVLAEGVGHLEGTALPIGGPGTHAVLTGHRGLATAELFTRLDELQRDDRFTINVFGNTLTYRVTTTLVVDPSDTATLNPVPGKDLVTLVTCTPLGINSHRILVTGTRVLPTPIHDTQQAKQLARQPGSPLWAGAGITAVVLVTIYLRTSKRGDLWYPPRRR